MRPIGNTVQFTGLWGDNPKKRLEKNVKRIEQEQQAAAKAKAAEQKAAKLAAQTAEIREVLSQTLFTDKQGDFQGWHLLKLIEKSEDASKTYWSQFWLKHYRKPIPNTVKLSLLRQQFQTLGAQDKLNTVIGKLKHLELVKEFWATDGDFLILTERGKQVLEKFKKDVRKGGLLSGKRGTYTFE